MIHYYVEKLEKRSYTISMKSFLTITLFITFFVLLNNLSYGQEKKDKPDMLYGQRFGIQVSSEEQPVAAYRKYPIYRPFAKPFLYQSRVEICSPNKVCKLEKRYRLIIGLYKTKKEAEIKLKEFKTKNPTAFKDSFVQTIVE